MRRVVELAVLLEDRLKLAFRDADPGIPYLYDDASLAAAAAKQHLALPGIFEGVRKQVADYLLQQVPVAPDRGAAPNHAQIDPLGLRMIGEFALQPVQ